MLHEGKPLREVLRSCFGTSDAGRQWVERIMECLFAAWEKSAPRRKAVELLLRTLEGLRRHGSTWRVTDHAGFVGHAHVWGHPIDADGVVDTATWKRIGHLAAVHAGGLAARMHRSPRTLHEYRRRMRAGRILRSQRTHRRMSDATLPKAVLPFPDAEWGYAQTWLAFPPSAELVARLESAPPPRYPARHAPRFMPSRPNDAANDNGAGHALIPPADVPY